MAATGVLQRVFDRLLGRSAQINAGGQGRRWGSHGLRAPSREVLARRALAGARAASFVANSPYGAAVLNAWVSNLVADGPSLRPKVTDRSAKRRILAAWDRFWDDCDADGVSDLAGFLQRLARSEFTFGEAFVHLSTDRGTGALRLRLWNPEQIDPAMTREIGEGRRIIAGIEFDADGRRTAYHVRENPDVPLAVSYTTRRVPAEDVLHVFEPMFPGQVRGISRLAPVASRLAEVDKLEDALLAKANTAALFGGIFVNPDEGAGAKAGPANADGDFDMEPGVMMFAPPGYDVRFTDPPSTEGAVDFLRSQVRSIGAGVGIPYELVSADLSQVNYSSARVGLLEFRGRITALRRTLIVARVLQPVWRRWSLLEGLAGRMDIGSALTIEASFVFPGWPQIDPLKETQADAHAIAARIKSRFEIVGARGRDPEEVDEEIAQDPAPPAAPATPPVAADPEPAE